MTKKIKTAIGTITLLIGLLMITESESNITGAVLGIHILSNSFINTTGLIFILSSIMLFTTEYSGLERMTLTSNIKKHESILKLTQKAVENQRIEKEANDLISRFYNGNFEAGLGKPGHIDNTDIFYLRGRNGARVYYHKIGDNSYEIVAKSAKGRNQDQVINKLSEIYKKN